MNFKKTFNIILVLIAIGLIGACSQETISENKPLDLDSLDSENLKTINSQKELEQLFSAEIFGSQSIYGTSSLKRTIAAKSFAVGETDSSIGIGVLDNDGGGDDYSQTNVQVQGIDEADITKTDGEYIYTLSQNTLKIIKAYPVQDAKLITTLKFEEDVTPREFFIQDNTLVILGQSYTTRTSISQYTLLPEERYESLTEVLVYDISNKEKPELLEDYGLEGNYFEARLYDNHVYIISQKGMDYGVPIMPTILRGEERFSLPQVYYFDFEPQGQFTTIASLSLENPELLNARSFLLQYGSTLYMSKNALYVAYQLSYSENRVEVFQKVVLPQLPNSEQTKFDNLKTLEEIYDQLEISYNTLSEPEKEIFQKNIQRELENYYQEIEALRRQTIIHKFDIDEGQIKHSSQTNVQGHLLNQFSLDEYDSNLRVATTTSFWNRKEGQSTSYNNVFVLDKDLEQIGALEKLAEDERIYSTRFLGDILYMVTFKQVDPLFVIDLSTPTNPQVKGKLKIPGFSNYLHPYKEGFLIGVGKETKENEWGGIITTGVKVSLFDVSNLNDPKEVDTYIIPGRYSDTEVSYDHKAFLLDTRNDLLVLPVRQDLNDENKNLRYDAYKYFRGVYVLGLSKEGIELESTIAHKADEKGFSYWWDSPYSVKRSLYIEDILYTISQAKVLAHNIKSMEEIEEIDLEYEFEKQRVYPYYVEDVEDIIGVESED